MPDHLHAVIQIGSVDLISIVRSFKAYVSGRCTQGGLPSGFWQSRFYDRGIREHDDIDELVKYILDNPVEEGFAAHWEDYPWLGGTLLETNT
jgi:REP element-mobilizing transposase RayT